MPPGGATLDFKGKSAVVLAWVVLEGHADRRRLARTLWPSSGFGQARSNLRVLVHRINLRCGAELLLGTEHLTLDRSQVRLDLCGTQAVLSALRSGGAERCELLAEAGIETEAGEELQAWLQDARQRLRREQLAGLNEALAVVLASPLDGADLQRAVSLARACVQLEPLSEQLHRQLMDVLARGGDRAAALTAYEECKQLLDRDLGVLPDQRTRTMQLNILRSQGQPQALAWNDAAGQSTQALVLAPVGSEAHSTMVGREKVLQQAQEALARGLHVLVHGEPGVGTTRLLRHLTESGGGGVEQLTIFPGLKLEPYAAVAQLLHEVHPKRGPRIDMSEQIELARLAPLVFADVKPSQGALSVPRLHAALNHWLTRLAQVGVQVLMLDNLHRADAASQAAIGALLVLTASGGERGERGGRAVALLLGYRNGEIEPALEETLVAAQVQRQARSIALSRLSLPEVQTLLRSMDAARYASNTDALSQQLFKRTGGNPLFVIELAQLALDQDHGADAANLHALLRSRLEGCSAPAQQLAAVAAVAAEDFTVDLAAAVMGLPVLGLMRPWSELEQRGLFAEQGLAHDLVKMAVLAGLPQAFRHSLHCRAALHLESQGLQGAAVLHHLLAGSDVNRTPPPAQYPRRNARVGRPRAIRLVVAFPPGGLNDNVARLMVPRLQRELGQAVVIDNMAGMGGAVGACEVANAEPDGNTLLIATPPLTIAPALCTRLCYDPSRLAPVAFLGRVPNVLLVNPRSGINSVADLLKRAEKSPGELTCASTGSGTSPHLSAELLKIATGTFITHIPYRGSAAAIAALIAGEIDLAFDNLSAVIGQIADGHVKALAVTTRQRSPVLSQIPSLTESELPQFDVSAWFGLAAPAGLHVDVKARLEAAMASIARDSDVLGSMQTSGAEVQFLGGATMGNFMAADAAKWKRLAPSLRISVE